MILPKGAQKSRECYATVTFSNLFSLSFEFKADKGQEIQSLSSCRCSPELADGLGISASPFLPFLSLRQCHCAMDGCFRVQRNHPKEVICGDYQDVPQQGG